MSRRGAEIHTQRFDNRFLLTPQALSLTQLLHQKATTEIYLARLTGLTQPTISRALGGRSGIKTYQILFDALSGLPDKKS